MKSKKLLVLLLSLTFFAGFLTACGSEDASTDQNSDDGQADGSTDTADGVFYEGETIEFLVPFGAGGGTDTFARFMAPYFSDFVEGNPDVQVVNVPGGGSINGANEFVELREHNGLNVLVTSASTHAPYLLGEEAVRFDLKEMIPVAGLPTGGVVYTSPSTGIESPEDLLNPQEDLVYAGISATGLDLVTLLSFEVLGMDVQAVLGYDGRGPSRVAFEQGESNIDYQTSSAFLTNVTPLVESGDAIPMYSFGQLNAEGDIVRDPAFPDLPSIKEVYVELHGEEPSGPAWEAYKTFVGASFTVQKVFWLHSDAPSDAVDALKQASEEMAQDSEFKEKGGEVLGGYDLYVGEEVDQVVNGMLNVDPEVVDWVKEFLKDNYGVERLD